MEEEEKENMKNNEILWKKIINEENAEELQDEEDLNLPLG